MSRFAEMRKKAKAMGMKIRSEGGSLVIYGFKRLKGGPAWRPLARCKSLDGVEKALDRRANP